MSQQLARDFSNATQRSNRDEQRLGFDEIPPQRPQPKLEATWRMACRDFGTDLLPERSQQWQ